LFNSGDWIPLSLPTAIASFFPQARFISLGGATEATVWSNWYEVREVKPEWKSIPYGRPISNARYYLLDETLRPVPIGVVGHLYIAGECLANGYTDVRLTAERFIASPFVEGDRLYSTGDLGRYQPDGNIEFLGRNDFQVKIRGFRIELGEIELRLREHPGVAEAVVLAQGEMTGDKRLVAYLVGNGDPSLDAASGGAFRQQLIRQVREHLRERLPEHMLPSAWIVLERFPLNSNGKLDRKALPAPQTQRGDDEEYIAPRTELERALAGIWAQLLRVDQIGIQDNFFELGGHSLLASRVVAHIGELLGVDLPVSTVFEKPTIAALSDWVVRKVAEEVSREVS
jgi:acyl-coenzyme A synthetase/AMP-(fatty) acid ligase